MKLSHLDHLVLTVKDLNATVAFYTRVLNMTKEIFSGNRVALNYGNQKINLHQANHEHEPKAACPTPGSADLCFITHGDLNSAMAHVCEQDVEIIEGPVVRTGTTGPIISFYFRDPDNNLIEVSSYDT